MSQQSPTEATVVVEPAADAEAATREPRHHPARDHERGAAVVEWLGISALSMAMLVVMFAAMQQLGVDLVADLRGSLGL